MTASPSSRAWAMGLTAVGSPEDVVRWLDPQTRELINGVQWALKFVVDAFIASPKIKVAALAVVGSLGKTVNSVATRLLSEDAHRPEC